MTIVVDPAFSVYRLLQRNHNRNFLLRHRDTMLCISYEIEDAAAASTGETRIFAGFQQMSRFMPQADRYRELAQRMESVYILGVPDVEPPPIQNLHYIRLSPDDQLAREWFVASCGSGYASVLATEEVPAPGRQRLFKGMWTFNPFIVSLIGESISGALGVRPITWETDDLRHRGHLRGMVQSFDRLILQIDQSDRTMLDDRLALMRRELAETRDTELNADEQNV